MTMIAQAGTYLANPTGWGISAEDGKCPSFDILFTVTQMKDGGEWTPSEGVITGYFNLVKKDGSINEINARSLKDSLGWDGASFDTLENGNWSEKEVQIVVEEDTYNGKTQLKVRYLNPRDYTGGGGVQKADPAKLKGLDQKYGATLRAMFGTKPAAKPAAKANGTSGLTVNPADAAKSEAWNALRVKTPTYDTEQRTESFKTIAKQIHPTKEPRDLDADDWREVTRRIEKDFSEATGELVPF